MPQTIELTREMVDALDDIFGELWVVIVHNDDVTTFETVITALTRIFGHSHDAAEALAWKVHREGQAEVFSGSKEEALAGVKALHGYRIQASAKQA